MAACAVVAMIIFWAEFLNKSELIITTTTTKNNGYLNILEITEKYILYWVVKWKLL